MLTIYLQTNNDVFHDDDDDVVSPEALAEVLENLATEFRDGGGIERTGAISDSNGNKIGQYTFT